MHSIVTPPTQPVSLSLFTSKAFRMLPESIQELGRSALHAIHFGWGDPSNRRMVDYAEIAGMIGDCMAMMSADANGKTRLLGLCLRINERHDDLLARWPYSKALHDDHVWTRGVEERLLASMAIWHLELSMRALSDGDTAGR